MSGLGDALWRLAVSMTTVGFAATVSPGKSASAGKVLVVIILPAILISFVQRQLALSFQQSFAAKRLTEGSAARARADVRISARYIACCRRFNTGRGSRRQREER